MPTVHTASPDDIWPLSSGGCPHPPAVRDEIIRVARSEISHEDCRNVGFAPWYAPYFVAEQRVLERQQRHQEAERSTAGWEIDRLRAENRDLRARLERVERWFGPSKTGDFKLMDMIVDVVGKALGHVHKEIDERIDKVERAAPVPVPLPSSDDLAKLERQGPPVYYEGIWQPLRAYQPGAMVTKDGAAWVATNAMAAGVEPGKGATAWKLAVKAPTAGLRKMVESEVRKQLGTQPVVR